MNSIKYILVLALFTVIACNNAPERPAPILSPDYQAPGSAASATPATPTAEPAQNADGVWHYTCSNGCEGGAGSAQPCTGCGSTLAHNAEYHKATNTNNVNQSISTTPLPAGSAGLNVTPNVAPKTAEPAQNANGVWHYTCSSGCDGGAGSAVACGSCGATLAHNALYHQ